MKKRILTTVGLISLFLVGLSVLLYPIISDYVNSRSQSRVVAQYQEELAHLSQADYSDLLDAARQYNEKLRTKSNRFMLSEDEIEEYYTMLNFTGKGIIGTIEIDIINVKLPIYLGTEESILQAGIGHLEGSSLPIGGPGTHSVISGHRGLPSSTLLTHADRLVKGDIFTLKILNETLHYEIDQIVIVEPDNLENLGIDPDKDYCTLITCTPLGVNSHRLLMRGVRVFPENGDEQPRARVLRADAKRVNVLIVYLIVAAPILLGTMVYTMIKNRKSKKP